MAGSGTATNGGGGGGLTIKTSKACTTDGAHSVCTINTLSTAPGDTIIIGGGVYNGGGVTVSSAVMNDGGSTACTQDLSVTPSGIIYYYRCANIPSGVTQVTITLSGNQYSAFVATPITPASAGSITVYVTGTGNASSGSSVTTNSITPTSTINAIIFRGML